MIFISPIKSINYFLLIFTFSFIFLSFNNFKFNTATNDCIPTYSFLENKSFLLCISNEKCSFKYYQSETKNRFLFNYLLQNFFNENRELLNSLVNDFDPLLDYSPSSSLLCNDQFQEKILLPIISMANFCKETETFIMLDDNQIIGCVCRNGDCSEAASCESLNMRLITLIIIVVIVIIYVLVDVTIRVKKINKQQKEHLTHFVKEKEI
jgi:hypothetical protein